MANVGEELPDGTTAFGDRTKTCTRCNGGKVVAGPQQAGMRTREMVQCPTCQGTGVIPKAAYER